MPPATGPLSLIFGSKGADGIEFVLDRSSEPAQSSFIEGPVNITLLGEPFKTEHRSGIESLALAYFRDDLRSILDNKGTVMFGDHDYAIAITLVRGDDGYRLTLDWPADDLWDLPLGEPSSSDLEEWIDVIDAAERHFGPLVGHCGGCGVPKRWFQPHQ